MATLVYSPGLRVRISTINEGIVDVTEDVIGGSVVLNEDETHRINLTLLNPRRRYDGVFTPMDRFSIQLKRLKWLPIVSGYLGRVPYFSVWPRSVTLSGECSLRRLKYYMWDPGTSASQTLLTQTIQGATLGSTDGGLKVLIRELATTVGRWNPDHIHIGEIPAAWIDATSGLFEQIQAAVNATHALGRGTMMGGHTVDDLGVTALDNDPFHQLPITSGRSTWFGGPNGRAKGTMNIRGTWGGLPDNQQPGPCGAWYCAMRWPYARWEGRTTYVLDGAAREENKQWWAQQRILVYNPTTHRAVVVQPADWGPAGWTGVAIDLSQTAFNALGNFEDDNVHIRFAPPGTPCGPVDLSQIQAQTDAWNQQDPHASQRVTQPPGPSIFDSPAFGGGGGGNKPYAVGDVPANIKFEMVHSGPQAGLQQNVHAAWQFINQAFPGATFVSGVARRGNVSDHPKGLAIDVGGPRQVLDQVAYWFADNPEAFGTKYVIWWDSVISRSRKREGWREYDESKIGPSNVTTRHEDHVHISFERGVSSLGPMGGDWNNDFTEAIGPVDSSAITPLVDTSGLAGSFQTTGSDIFTGPLALMNDKPLLEDIRTVARSSMRSLCSAPNGDLIAWFPDYFGIYGTAGTMTVRSIEIKDIEIDWSDERLKTHQFVAGGIIGLANGIDAGSVAPEQILSQMAGIASIDFPQLLRALFGEKTRQGALESQIAILERFGPRPEFTSSGVLVDNNARFWYAVKRFMDNWASQFSTKLELTFMPELFPGMLLEIEGFNLRLYVKQVSHNINFTSGFSTTVTVVAPSRREGDGGLFGLEEIKGHKVDRLAVSEGTGGD